MVLKVPAVPLSKLFSSRVVGERRKCIEGRITGANLASREIPYETIPSLEGGELDEPRRFRQRVVAECCTVADRVDGDAAGHRIAVSGSSKAVGK
jgi:hypothetical protein